MSGQNFTFRNFTPSYRYEVPFCFDVANQIFSASRYLDFLNGALGIPLNVWIIVAILTSTELRARRRNKILANICTQGLFECLVLFPLSLYLFFDQKSYLSSCHTSRAHYVLWFFSEFVSNWNLVTLLALVLFTLYGSSVTLGGWNRLITQVVTYSLLLWPWVFSVITIIPIIISNHQEEKVDTWSNQTYCYISLIEGVQKSLYAIDVGIPACVAAVLLAAIIFFNRKRSRDLSNRGDLTRQLIGDSSDSEPIIPYIAIVVIIFLCDFGKFVYFVYIQWRSFSSADCAVLILRVITVLIDGVRDVLLPLVFLLFPEVRSQAKKLILRCLPRRQIADITIAYVKDA